MSNELNVNVRGSDIDKSVNKLELTKEFIKVHSNSNKNVISSDYVLARFNEKEKEFCMEMYHNANFGLAIITRVKDCHVKSVWDKTTHTWQFMHLSEDQKQILESLGLELFDAFMARTNMISVVSRNTHDNHLIRIITRQEEDDTLSQNEEKTGFLAKIGDLFSKKGKKNEGER